HTSLLVSPTRRSSDLDSLLGMIVKEDGDDLTIQTGPSDALIQIVKKSEIKERQPQSSSAMPVGLLYTLSKEQILDLLEELCGWRDRKSTRLNSSHLGI